MLSYPVRLIPTETGAVKVIFPDVPEAVAEGKDEEDALERARAALELVLAHRLQERGKIPPPTDICGAPTVATEMFVVQETDADVRSPLSGGRY